MLRQSKYKLSTVVNLRNNLLARKHQCISVAGFSTTNNGENQKVVEQPDEVVETKKTSSPKLKATPKAGYKMPRLK